MSSIVTAVLLMLSFSKSYITYIHKFIPRPKGLFSEICNKTTIKYNKMNSIHADLPDIPFAIVSRRPVSLSHDILLPSLALLLKYQLGYSLDLILCC